MYGKEHIRCSINTNGTIMTEKIAKFLSKNFKNIVISVDGSLEVHNTNRIYFFYIQQKFYKNVKELDKDCRRALLLYDSCTQCLGKRYWRFRNLNTEMNEGFEINEKYFDVSFLHVIWNEI